MERIDSLDKNYSIINKLNNIEYVFMIVSFIFSIITIFYINWLIVISYIIILVLYFAEVISKELLIQKTENLRISNCIEKAYNQKINSKVTTELYYNNEDIESGITRFNLNIFESVFFSKKNVEKIFVFKILMYIFLFLVYVVSLILSDLNIALVITQTIFGSSILISVIKEIFYFVEINSIYNSFDEICVSGKYSMKINKEKMLYLSFRYEKLKSYAMISLSTKIFKKYNNDWTNEWEDYKKKYLFKN